MCMLPWARGGREETSEKQRTAVWEGELEQGLSNQRQPLREGEPGICTPALFPATLSFLLIHPKPNLKPKRRDSMGSPSQHRVGG